MTTAQSIKKLSAHPDYRFLTVEAHKTIRRIAGRLGALRRNPGDIGKLGDTAVLAMAIAQECVSVGPGWIPVVQAEWAKILDILEPTAV